GRPCRDKLAQVSTAVARDVTAGALAVTSGTRSRTGGHRPPPARPWRPFVTGMPSLAPEPRRVLRSPRRLCLRHCRRINGTTSCLAVLSVVFLHVLPASACGWAPPRSLRQPWPRRRTAPPPRTKPRIPPLP